MRHPTSAPYRDGGETESGAVFLVIERLVGRSLAGTIIGTPHYMASEASEAIEGELDPRNRPYSAAVVRDALPILVRAFAVTRAPVARQLRRVTPVVVLLCLMVAAFRADAAVRVAVANRTLRNAGGVTRAADLGRERSR